MTQGKCVECRVKYEWDTPQLFRDSYCIICRDKLKLTSCQLHTNESFAYGLGQYYVWHTTPYCILPNACCIQNRFPMLYDSKANARMSEQVIGDMR